jgi:hypothetical protein
MTTALVRLSGKVQLQVVGHSGRRIEHWPVAHLFCEQCLRQRETGRQSTAARQRRITREIGQLLKRAAIRFVERGCPRPDDRAQCFDDAALLFRENRDGACGHDELLWMTQAGLPA